MPRKIAGVYGGDQQWKHLLGELLADLQSLCWAKRHAVGTKFLGLFAIQLSPLSFIASQE
ncbi:MAG: hypothetical protein WA484_07205 [Solirubrobacteraceae bacterium]